ncbi:hypothetical protein D9758_012043 [Tetrapyrgos nigripes]|uniref:Uncharacterized protein n=1 Tax=Tetrapyrgos nigripes TaxID=182062 RepID=A0A8H5FJ89_9AGAR|nr:hypothetical protein D9758_012043 [Tetrapyrgos nigripes]
MASGLTPCRPSHLLSFEIQNRILSYAWNSHLERDERVMLMIASILVNRAWMKMYMNLLFSDLHILCRGFQSRVLLPLLHYQPTVFQLVLKSTDEPLWTKLSRLCRSVTFYVQKNDEAFFQQCQRQLNPNLFDWSSYVHIHPTHGPCFRKGTVDGYDESYMSSLDQLLQILSHTDCPLPNARILTLRCHNWLYMHPAAFKAHPPRYIGLLKIAHTYHPHVPLELLQGGPDALIGAYVPALSSPLERIDVWQWPFGRRMFDITG